MARRCGWAALLIVALGTTTVALAEEGPATGVLWVDGRPVALDSAPVRVNGTLMVPVRVLDAMGARIRWNANTRTAQVSYGGKEAVVRAGSRQLAVDKQSTVMPEAAAVMDGRLMVPIRSVAEAFGFLVEWDARQGRVHIKSPPRPEPQPAAAKPASGPPSPSPSPSPKPSDARAHTPAVTPYRPTPRPDPPPLNTGTSSLDRLLATVRTGAVMTPASPSLFPRVARAAQPEVPASSSAAAAVNGVKTAEVAGRPGESPPAAGEGTALPAPGRVPEPPQAGVAAAAGAAAPYQPSALSDRVAALRDAGSPAGPPAQPGGTGVLAPMRLAEATLPAALWAPASTSAPVTVDVAEAAPSPLTGPVRSTSGQEAVPAPSTASPPAGTQMVTITGVRVRREGGQPRIDLLASGPLHVDAGPTVLSDPPRLVLDVSGAILDPTAPDVTEGPGLVKRVRLGQFAPGVVRLAVDLRAPVGVRLDKEPVSDGSRLGIVVNHAVAGAHWMYDAEGRGQLWLEMSGLAAVQTAVLRDPDRLVVDVQGATLTGTPGEWAIASGPVQRYRVSQFRPDVVRVVMELSQVVRPRIITSKELTLALLAAQAGPGKEPAATSRPNGGGGERGEIAPAGDVDVVLDVFSRVTDVAVRPLGKEGVSVVVHADGALEPRAFVLRQPDRLVIDLPGAVLDPSMDRSLLEAGAGEDATVSVRAGQFLPRSARIVVTMEEPMGYRLVTADEGSTAVVALGDQPLRGKTVAIDPGHGGFDGGAMGASGTPEKFYNLDVAERLARLLEASGVEVTLTRRDDTFVTLDDRVRIASHVGAQILLSIHNNASTSGEGVGTEVFFARNHEESRRLAVLLHDAMVQRLGTVDRGVKLRQELRVLRLAPMPAALVEIAFVDHPEDEKRLLNPSFRQRAAEALFSAIVSYFSEVGDNTVREVAAAPAKADLTRIR